jgi:hypothetical protein
VRAGALAKELGACRERLSESVIKSGIHGRRTPSGSHRIVWADAQELGRLRRLVAISKPGLSKHRACPSRLLIPRKRSPD